jgi:chemotaxis protein methyltransferase CheR
MEPDDMAVGILSGLLESRTGQQLTNDRRWRISTALSGLFRDRGIATSSELVAKLTQPEGLGFAREVVEALLNNETYFYRDRAMFELLTQRVLPDLHKRRAKTRKLTIWSAGCSSGQEPLTLAMLIAENRLKWEGWTVDILGTDVSGKIVELACKGRYSHFEVQRGLSVAQMLRYFEETPSGWVVKDDLQSMVRYQKHNLLDVPPAPGQFDLILCRNVLLYFDVATRRRAFDRLALSLAPDGVMMLGAGETVVGHTEKFVPLPGNQGLYRLMNEGGERVEEEWEAGLAG